MRKILAITAILLLLFPAFNSNHAFNYQLNELLESAGDILYVGGSGPNNYTSIQDAVNDAEDGCTIFVFNGTYEESVHINKRINLIGESAQNVILKAVSGYGINVSCNNVLIKNISITNASWNGEGICIYSSNRTVEKCMIYGNEWTGIELNGNENRIMDCVIWKNSIGIEIDGNENDLTGCQMHENGAAIKIHGNRNRVRNCIISNNSWNGIEIVESSLNEIYNCSFEKNGIYISGTSMKDFIHEIHNNTIDGSPIIYIKNSSFELKGIEAGEIIAVGCNNFIVENSEIAGGDISIEIAYCNNGLIKNCSINGRVYGMLAFNSDKNSIEKNYINGSNESGIELIECDENKIENNEIEGINGNAILLQASCNNEINKNSIKRNGMGILVFSYSDYNNISRNYVSNNQFYGISVQGGSHNIIEENNIRDNKGWCGIAIVKSWTKYNVVRRNNISANKCGVHLEGIGNMVEKNNIYGNERGIYLSSWLSKCKRNVIKQNNFIDNSDNVGFEVDIFSFNIWTENYWDDWNKLSPKPIYGHAILKFGLIGLRIPWINFDFTPAAKPYEIEA